MKMIVGLGNPGAEYDNTRHNVGFLVVDELARRENILTWQKKMSAEIGEYRAYGEKVLLVKPQTYMNLSGEAVGQIARFYKIDAQDIIVISDDMDLPLGRLRLKNRGSSGGHRGIESILCHLDKADFVRVRVGIGRPPQGWTVNNYVLSRFYGEEAETWNGVCKRTADSIQSILADGLTKAMNTFNQG
ncbi:MAG: aminoacyl-tRNA hydrolase [Selenomonadales bacterium]|nr:aminoacyl-tRNA hydrolase [Selenomonadales bacterium]